MEQKIKNLLKILLNIIFPEHCGFCGREIALDKWICPNCAKLVPLQKCDGSVPEKFENAAFDKLFYAGIYEGRTRDGILRLKKGKAQNAAKYMAAALVENIKSSGIAECIDFISYVPVSPKRKVSKGYDHAEVMARILSQMLSIPIVKSAIRRKNKRKSQHTQRGLAKRQKLAQTVYTVPKKKINLDGKTVLLCDDIITSGATLSKCADILKFQGAVYVFAAALVKAG